MKVGIFDSGIGGLSVLHHAMKKIPDGEFIYYADEAHVPYGEKSVEEIKTYIHSIFEFLIKEGVDAILIACNTATSVAAKEFRAQYPVPIVGMEPAVKKAVELYGDTGKRILVMATPVTIAGDKLHNLLERVDTEHDVDLIPLPKLVRFAECGDFDSEEVKAYLREELKQFDLKNYTAVVLGCTHFNYFKETLRKVFPEYIHFVDGNEGTVNQLIRVTGVDADGSRNGLEPKVTYYYSGKKVSEEEAAEIENYMRQLDKVYSYS